MRLKDYLWVVMAVVVVITTFVLGEVDTAGTGTNQCADYIGEGCKWWRVTAEVCCIDGIKYNCMVDIYTWFDRAKGETYYYYLRRTDCKPLEPIKRCSPADRYVCPPVKKTSLEDEVTL